MGKKTICYCDRCGKDFEYKFSKWAGYFTKGIRKRTVIGFHELYYGNMSGYEYSDRKYELCADCTEKFLNFLRSGRKEKEEGEK